MPDKNANKDPKSSTDKDSSNEWKILKDVYFAGGVEATDESKKNIAAQRAREKLEAEQREWAKNHRVLGDEKGLNRVLKTLTNSVRNTFGHMGKDGWIKTAKNTVKFGVG